MLRDVEKRGSRHLGRFLVKFSRTIGGFQAKDVFQKVKSMSGMDLQWFEAEGGGCIAGFRY